MIERKKVICKLSTLDGNAFSILGRVSKAMRQAGWSREEITEFHKEATVGNYDNLLRVCMEYVEEPEEDGIEELLEDGDE